MWVGFVDQTAVQQRVYVDTFAHNKVGCERRGEQQRPFLAA